MPSGSETIKVVPAWTKDQLDRNDDPIEGATREERSITGCILIPRTEPDRPDVIIDGYQVVMTDTTQEPPAAEDQIKIRGTEKAWFINGNVGDYTKASGETKVFIFVIQSVR